MRLAIIFIFTCVWGGYPFAGNAQRYFVQFQNDPSVQESKIEALEEAVALELLKNDLVVFTYNDLLQEGINTNLSIIQLGDDKEFFLSRGIDRLLLASLFNKDNHTHIQLQIVDVLTDELLFYDLINIVKPDGEISYPYLKDGVFKSLSNYFYDGFGIGDNYISALDAVQVTSFPFPPPTPSAREKISLSFFKDAIDLGDAYTILSKALNDCGYSDRSVYPIPNGFAIVTRIEQINSDATTLLPPERWSLGHTISKRFSITRYLKSLFGSDPGFYQLIVILVTDNRFSTKPLSLEIDDANFWLYRGLNDLPAEIADLPLTSNHTCEPFFYEFISPDSGQAPYLLLPPCGHTGDEHLTNSRILESLEKNR